MIVSNKYKAFLALMNGNDPESLRNIRVILLTGGRNSQKSFVSSLGLVQSMFTEKQSILYSRYTMTSAEKSIIPEFNQKIQLLDYQKYFKITQNEILLPSYESKILFSGIKASSGNQTANLKGLKDTSIFCLDEAEEMVDKEMFDKIVFSIRCPFLRNFIVIIMNPSDVDHFVYNEYIGTDCNYITVDGVEIPISSKKNVLHIHTTYLDNLKNIRPENLNEILTAKEKNIEYYNHVFLGLWRSNSLFIPFQLSKLLRFKLKEFDLSVDGYTVAACDTKLKGTDFFSYIIGRIQNNKIYIIDCVFTELEYKIAVPLIDAIVKKYNVRESVVETNAAGIMFLENFAQQHPTRRWLGVNHTATMSKISRILFEQQNILDFFVFRTDYEIGSDYDKMIRNLTTFRSDGKNEHDEAPDTLAMLSKFVGNIFNR